MTAPIAPHIAEELWSRLGHDDDLASHATFPAGDPVLAAEAERTIPVQVNGKVRFTLQVPDGAAEPVIRDLLTAHPDYARHTEGRTIRKLIVVPGRIVNIALG
jgi:leucyl-tRNA synthetase